MMAQEWERMVEGNKQTNKTEKQGHSTAQFDGIYPILSLINHKNMG
jgi:hypothetical protein